MVSAKIVNAFGSTSQRPLRETRPGWRLGTDLRPGLDDPLQTAAAVHVLLDSVSGKDNGMRVNYGGDFHTFAKLRALNNDDKRVAPLFDPDASRLNKDNGFWLCVENADGEVVAWQAFRMEFVSTSLAEWALGWVLGIYLKRDELIIPKQTIPNDNSISHTLSGCLVYHGELWIDPKIKRRDFVAVFSKLGMVLAHIKWNPDAIWALVGRNMVTRGHMSRMGYAHSEPGFLDWDYRPEGAEGTEWLGVADRRSLCRMVEQLCDSHDLDFNGTDL